MTPNLTLATLVAMTIQTPGEVQLQPSRFSLLIAAAAHEVQL